MNPATEPPLDSSIAVLHLVGDQDTVAPARLSQGYLDRVSVDYVWHFASFDHVCCWVEQWPDLFARIEAALQRRQNPRVEKQDPS